MGDGEIAERPETLNRQAENISSLESAIDQFREEAKESGIAKATVDGLKEEVVSDSAAVLKGIVIAIAALLLCVVGKMIRARGDRIRDEYDKLVVFSASDKTATQSMVSAQHGLLTASEMLRLANISILKAWSIFFSEAPKHRDTVMMAMTGLAIFVAVIPFKFILMVLMLCLFTTTSKLQSVQTVIKETREVDV